MALIKAGADPTARDEDGNLPFAARSRDRKPSVRKIETPWGYGRAPLSIRRETS